MLTNSCNCSAPLAMASVPKQDWCEPYSWDQALLEGTIFPCLNLMFFKAPLSDEKDCCCAKPLNTKERNRECMMHEIDTISFAVNDLTLYLDTHPDCQHGLSLYYKLLEKRKNLLADFASQFYPLTALSMITGNCDSSQYDWCKGPMPWEGGCI